MLIDELAQEVVERGFGQLVSTLLLALTFGLAAPMAGLALGAAAGVQLVHHLCVLGQVVEVARLRHGHRRPKHVELHGCDRVPWGCGAVVTVTTALLWSCCCVKFLEPTHMAVGAISAACAATAVVMVFIACQRYPFPQNQSFFSSCWR